MQKYKKVHSVCRECTFNCSCKIDFSLKEQLLEYIIALLFNTKELDVLVVIATVCYFDQVVISFKIHHIPKSHAISSGLTSVYMFTITSNTRPRFC